MSTRLQWSRSGLAITCETSKRALPRTAWAFSLPPFSSLNTCSPGVQAALVTDSQTGVPTGVRVTSTGTLPAGYSYQLSWMVYQGAAPVSPEWIRTTLGSIQSVDLTIPVDLADATYVIYLSRTYQGVTEDYAETSITTPGETIPGNVTGLNSRYQNGQAQIFWDLLPDTRPIEYEIRLGTWEAGKILGRMPSTTQYFDTVGSGTYLVAGRWKGLYSMIPTTITISGATLVKNVVVAWDETALGWTGTRDASLGVDSLGNLYLTGTTLCDDVSGLCDAIVGLCDFIGPIASSGVYEGHVVDIGAPQVCTLSVLYSLSANVLGVMVDDVLGLVDSLLMMLDSEVAGLVDALVQIALSQDGVAWSDWQRFTPGQYVARAFKARIILTTTDTSVSPMVGEFTFTVDMQDRTMRYTGLSVEAAIPGITQTFTPAFQIIPNIQVTIHDGAAGDTWIRDSISTSGVSGHVVDGTGTLIARTVDITAQAY